MKFVDHTKKIKDASTQGERTTNKHNHGLWQIGELIQNQYVV